MRWVTLEAVSDDYDHSPGLALKGAHKCEGFMADRITSPDQVSLIAHDIIEHQNGPENIGPVWDELEALGGVWQARGRWGDVVRQFNINSPEQHMASDIVRMASEVAWRHFRDEETMGRRPPPKTRACDQDEAFHEIIEIARDGIRKERQYDDSLKELDVDLYLSECLDRMRIGYRKAVRRWGDRFRSNSQFWEICRTLSKVHPDYEGQQFRLGYGDGKCVVHEVYEEEY